MTDQRLPNELVLSSVPTAPQASPMALEGFASPTTPSVPTPGVSSAASRVPTAPTLPDDPTHLTGLIARLATELYGVQGGGIGAAPEYGSGAAPAAGPAAAAAPAPAPAPAAAPAPAPAPAAAPANPFMGEPSFDAVLAQLDAPSPSFTLPLFDAPAPSAPKPSTVGEPTAPASVEALLPTSSALLEPHLGIDLSRDAAPSDAKSGPRANGGTGGAGFDAHALREEFPILRERVHGKRLVWLDNAATTQKPKAVIDRLVHYYEHENSNIHRAAHALAARATDAYEGARESVRRFVNARSVDEVVFVRGTTEGINLVAQSWGRRYIEAGDEILITWLEHHANIVPWQMLAKEKGAKLKVAPVDDRGQILLDEYEKLITSKTKLVALPQVSNALGTITPAKAMIDIAHRHGATVLLDAAQSVSHMRQDVQALDADFFVFSGHKVFAPTGIGAVVAKASIWEQTPPWQGGGNMIQDVTFERTVFQPPPARFEAGTGNIADAVGLGAALDWLTRVGIENVERHEHDLLVYGTERLCQIPGLTIIGTAPEKAGVLSFVIDGHSTQDVSAYLDKQGVAVRGGHHCAQPILRRFGKESTVRASLAPYNTTEDLDVLVEALQKLVGGQAR
jgi:cysteine desulfurase/selenocysteine lyase